jgi:hypothetical protein
MGVMMRAVHKARLMSRRIAGVTLSSFGSPNLAHVTRVLQERHTGATSVLQACYKRVTSVLQGCYKRVTRVLQGCYEE